MQSFYEQLKTLRNYFQNENETKEIRDIIARSIKEKWEKKRMHGQFPCSIQETLVDKEQSYR
jgi:hypothetical protein